MRVVIKTKNTKRQQLGMRSMTAVSSMEGPESVISFPLYRGPSRKGPGEQVVLSAEGQMDPFAIAQEVILSRSVPSNAFAFAMYSLPEVILVSISAMLSAVGILRTERSPSVTFSLI